MRKPGFFSPAEWEVLQFILEANPVAARVVADHFAVEHGWVRTTVLTLIERLTHKGYLVRERSSGVHLYRPSRPAAELMRSVVSDFVEKALGGSVSPFLAYLDGGATVSAEQLAELKQLVKRLEEREEHGDA
ncbi:MAG: BlaI/MecI/CopY family transcriptional regulator [Armatimonadetes bacterium]|nr:BlaI/MecI/CopY family transcriptional regulator [Armatimonadota bacterium]MDE2205607.1 BlaI/MecI/CopY family transcriptional regulator [Armatimonadota bacterium]